MSDAPLVKLFTREFIIESARWNARNEMKIFELFGTSRVSALFPTRATRCEDGTTALPPSDGAALENRVMELRGVTRQKCHGSLRNDGTFAVGPGPPGKRCAGLLRRDTSAVLPVWATSACEGWVLDNKKGAVARALFEI